MTRGLVTAAALLAAFAAGCGGDDGDGKGDGNGSDKRKAPAATQAARVDIAEFKFKPPTVRLAAGGNVTFTNSDRASHTATAGEDAPADFDTDRLEQGDTKTIPFGDSGTYAYICTFHPYMKGTIEVE